MPIEPRRRRHAALIALATLLAGVALVGSGAAASREGPARLRAIGV